MYLGQCLQMQSNFQDGAKVDSVLQSNRETY